MRSKTGHWMPMYWADYFADTTHFTAEEHGAYLLLIGTYWRRGFALPDDNAFLASTAKLTVRRFKSVMHNLSEKFIIVDELWYHVRVENELLRSCERIAKASASAHARWDAPAMLPTSTTTKEERKNLSNDFLVGSAGKKNGQGNGHVTIKDSSERLSRFQVWLARALGPDGWHRVAEAADPTNARYGASLALCKAKTKELGKGWPNQWPI